MQEEEAPRAGQSWEGWTWDELQQWAAPESAKEGQSEPAARESHESP